MTDEPDKDQKPFWQAVEKLAGPEPASEPAPATTPAPMESRLPLAYAEKLAATIQEERVIREREMTRKLAIRRRRYNKTGDHPPWLAIALAPAELKGQHESLYGPDKTKFVAMLTLVYSRKYIAGMLGVKMTYIDYCATKHRDLRAAAEAMPADLISKVAQSKIVGLVHSLDPEQVPHDRKAQSAKFMADLIYTERQMKDQDKGEEDKREKTGDLMQRIKSRMREHAPGGMLAENNEQPNLGAIDVTPVPDQKEDEK